MTIRTIWVKGEVPYTKNFGTLAELLALVPSTEFAEGFASDHGRIDWVKGSGWMSGGKLLSADGSASFAGPIVAPNLIQWCPEAFNPTNSSDWTDAFNAMFAAVQANKGGDIILQPNKTYRINSVITLPNSGVGEALCSSQYPMRIRGAGGSFVGMYPGRSVARPSTTLDLRGSGPNARLITLGQGLLEISGVRFADLSGTANNSTPFIKTTCTTLNLHDNSFEGALGLSGVNCATDAIILGGTNAAYGTGPNDAFGGYGTLIKHNYFERIRRGIVANVWAESNDFEYNVWSNSCGGDCAILITTECTTPTGDDPHNAGNKLSFNRYCGSRYVTLVKVLGSSNILSIGNTAWDNSWGICRTMFWLGKAVVDGVLGGGEGAYPPRIVSMDAHDECSPDGPFYYSAELGTDKYGVQLSGWSTGDLYQKGFYSNTGGMECVGTFYAKSGLRLQNTTGSVTRVIMDGTSLNPIQPQTGIMLGMGSGTTAQRPGVSYGKGIYFDTTLGYPIYSDGTNWRKLSDNAIV